MKIDGEPARNGKRDSLDLSVVMSPGAPAHARGKVTGWLTGQVSDGVLVDANLLISELVTNTLHGDLAVGAMLSINGRLNNTVLWLEVGNPGHAGTVARRAAKPHNGNGGYGLQLVDLLALRWGVNRDSDALTRVWFELATA